MKFIRHIRTLAKYYLYQIKNRNYSQTIPFTLREKLQQIYQSELNLSAAAFNFVYNLQALY